MILNRIKSFFEKYNISLENKKVCVCFSGGADSVALLEAMREINKTEQFSLCAVHVNHHIRGQEADDDEKFCESFCEKRDIPFYAFGVYALEEAEKSGCGIEAAARKLRYKAFGELKEKKSIDYFLTAHHANDLAETVVFNLIRGSSVSGLAGIPHVRDCYLRPLIQCSREDILDYVSFKGLSFVEDSTNSDEAYTRNYIRHSLLPAFERVNSNYISAILRLSESAIQDSDYFDKELDKITSETDLSLLHPSLTSRYVCKQYEVLSEGEGLSAVHVKQILSCIESREEKCIDVPFGIKAIVRNGKVNFIKKTEIQKSVSEENTVLLFSDISEIEDGITEKTFLEKAIIRIEKKYINLKSNNGIVLHPTEVALNGKNIKGTLYVRSRKEGDKIFCRKMTRNINKELVNLKIPKYLRERIPVICDDEGVVFVPLIGADDRVYSKEKSDFPLYISVCLDKEISDNLYF